MKKLRRQFGPQSDWLPGQIELVARLKNTHSEKLCVIRPRDCEKMSEILGTFAEPLLEHATTYEERMKAFTFATIVWNFSLVPMDPGTEKDQDLPDAFREPKMREIFDFMLARKQQLYPDNQRIIMDFQLNDSPEKYLLNVVSTLPETAIGTSADKGATRVRPPFSDQEGKERSSCRERT